MEPARPSDDRDEGAVERLREARTRLKAEIARVVVGQDQVLDELLMALLCRGHVLMLGVPGLGKTLMAKTVAQTLEMDFNRIQFTPDLMPSDIIGTDIVEEDPESGRRRLNFFQGPLFTRFLLADEINRAPPKTQSALLQAMQEREVSIGRRTYKLEAAVLRRGHPEPDRAGGDVPAPGSPARPVHVQHPGHLSHARRGSRDRQGDHRERLDRGPPGPRRSRRSSSSRSWSGASRWPTPWSAMPSTWWGLPDRGPSAKGRSRIRSRSI